MEQIVYQENLNTFLNDCLISNDIANKIEKGMRNAGYTNVRENWIVSWKNSLPEIALVLKDSKIDKDVDVAVEYTLKHSFERIDFLIYGVDNNERKNMVIVELKQWSSVNRTESLNRVHTLVARGHYEDHFHPSYQAQNYAGQLLSFNEYVQNEKLNIKTCSYCHNLDEGYKHIMEYVSLFPFIKDSPSFLEDDGEKLKSFIEKYVSKRCHEILYKISSSRTIPSDEFSKLIKEALKENQMYSLDATQQFALTKIVDAVRHSIDYDQKKTIIIKGGAGTGKSIIAINALGLLNGPEKKDDRITTMYVTANAAPRDLMLNELTKNKAFKKMSLKVLFKYPTTFINRPRNEIPCLLIDEAHRILIIKKVLD